MVNRDVEHWLKLDSVYMGRHYGEQRRWTLVYSVNLHVFWWRGRPVRGFHTKAVSGLSPHNYRANFNKASMTLRFSFSLRNCKFFYQSWNVKQTEKIFAYRFTWICWVVHKWGVCLASVDRLRTARWFIDLRGSSDV